MNAFITAPLLRGFIPFILAIVCKRLLFPDCSVSPMWLATLLVLLLLSERMVSSRTRAWTFIILSGLLFFLVGWSATPPQQRIQVPRQAFSNDAFSFYYINKITRKNKDVIYSEAELISNTLIVSNKRFKVYLSVIEPGTSLLHEGDIISTKNKPVKVTVGTSDRIFSFQQYLEKKGIYYMLTMKGKAIDVLRKENNSIQYVISNYQNQLGCTFENIESDTSSITMMKALVLGIDDSIDKDTRNQFGITGTMHILSVSGLHVAAVFWLVNLLLAFPKHKRWGRISKATIGILALWIYALLSGAEAPVLRSAFMFTFIQMGQSLRKNTHTFNLLILSAILLLLLNPDTAFNLGFQLSFGAIAGILAIQRPLADLLLSGINKKIRKILELMLVSISAQWFTWPLCLFTFHYFPNYFLISNLLLVPQSSILLYLGILYMILSPISYLEPLMNVILVKALWLFKWQLNFFSELPHAQSGPFAPDGIETLCLTVFMFSLTKFIYSPKLKNIIIPLSLLILQGMYICHRTFLDKQRSEFGLYYQSKMLHGWLLRGNYLMLWPEGDTLQWNRIERKRNRIDCVMALPKMPVEITTESLSVKTEEFSFAKLNLNNEPSVFKIVLEPNIKCLNGQTKTRKEKEPTAVNSIQLILKHESESNKEDISKHNTKVHFLDKDGRFVVPLNDHTFFQNINE